MYSLLNTLSYYFHILFIYQKSLFQTLFCLFLKPLKAFSVSLKKDGSGVPLVRQDFIVVVQ